MRVTSCAILVLFALTSLSLGRELSTPNGDVSIPLPKGWTYGHSSEPDPIQSRRAITIVPQETAFREGTTLISFSGNEEKALKSESPKRKVKSFSAGSQVLELRSSKTDLAKFYFTSFLRQGIRVYAVLTLTAFNDARIASAREDEFISIVRDLSQ